MTQTRNELLDFAKQIKPNYQSLIQIAGDASFRRYYRIVDAQGLSNIIMDAPPEHEDALKFSIIAAGFAQAGINVPEVIEADFDSGLLLISDFGDIQLLSKLIEKNYNHVNLAINELITLQKNSGQHLLSLPDYDHNLLLGELSLFSNWFIISLLDEHLSYAEENLVNNLYATLIDSALKQQKTWVHRDYHSRNIMIYRDKIGIIDFQDAVYGPITYDLVSLLKDCYFQYPADFITQQLKDYYINLVSNELIYMKFNDFVKSFDLMGLQRHLKVLGIFARLSIRDKKHAYLQDLPLTFFYVKEVINRYPELHNCIDLFSRLETKLNQKLKAIAN